MVTWTDCRIPAWLACGGLNQDPASRRLGFPLLRWRHLSGPALRWDLSLAPPARSISMENATVWTGCSLFGPTDHFLLVVIIDKGQREKGGTWLITVKLRSWPCGLLLRICDAMIVSS